MRHIAFSPGVQLLHNSHIVYLLFLTVDGGKGTFNLPSAAAYADLPGHHDGAAGDMPSLVLPGVEGGLARCRRH